MKDFKQGYSLLFIFIAIFIFACQGQKTDWKGTITTENGITVVQNPKEPMYGADALVLEEDLSISGDTTEGDSLFSQIRSIAVDNAGNIYVLDWKDNHVLAFDKMGRHLRTFGRAGQGPGEFVTPLTMGLAPDGEIVIEDYRSHLVYFTPEGEFIRNLPLAKTGVRRVAIDSRGNILGIVIVREKDNSRYEIQKFDPEMNLMHVLDSTPIPSESSDSINPFVGLIYYTFDKDDRVVCGAPDQYEIKTFSSTGNLVQKITRDYDPVEITEQDKKEIEKEMPPGIKLIIPKHYGAFQWIMTDDEGRIFVMTEERSPENRGYFHDVFDAQGRYLAKIPLAFRPIVIKKNKFYSVTEDEDGFHVIKRYNALWRFDE